MSSVRTVTLSLATALALALSGCATDGDADLPTRAEPTAEIDPQLIPATPEEREIASRMPPLEKANFWALEYAKTPRNLATALSFAKALAGIGSHERAVQVLTETEVIHPTSAEVKRLKARSLTAQEEFVDARRALQAAAMLAPGNADVLAALGLANDRLGDHATAQVAYRQALEIEPDRVATLSNFGLSLALTGDLDAAETHLTRAVELAGSNTNVRQNLALVLGLQGRYDEMMEAAGDAPEETMRRNAEMLRALRGEPAADDARPDTSDVPESGAEAQAEASKSALPLRRDQTTG